MAIIASFSVKCDLKNRLYKSSNSSDNLMDEFTVSNFNKIHFCIDIEARI